MPKLKSNRGAAKRFRKTATGYKCRGAFRSHHFTCKTMKQKRRARKGFIVREEDQGRLEQMLPYTR